MYLWIMSYNVKMIEIKMLLVYHFIYYIALLFTRVNYRYMFDFRPYYHRVSKTFNRLAIIAKNRGEAYVARRWLGYG
jgi:hypothetical protein